MFFYFETHSPLMKSLLLVLGMTLFHTLGPIHNILFEEQLPISNETPQILNTLHFPD